jgi:hypothetical protein
MQKKKSGKQVPQLGEQKKQSISPFKVPTTLEVSAKMMKYAVDCGLDIDQVFSQGYMHSAKLAWKYVHGQPQVPPEKMPYLQT